MYTYSGDAKLGIEHGTYSPITYNVQSSQINCPILFLVFSAVIKEETHHHPLHVSISIYLTRLWPLCPSTMPQRRSVSNSEGYVEIFMVPKEHKTFTNMSCAIPNNVLNFYHRRLKCIAVKVSENEGYCLLDCDAVSSGRNLLTCLKHLMPF